MIANFDENMGRLFARLTSLGLDEDTLVIFTADHGTAAGYDPETGALATTRVCAARKDQSTMAGIR